MADSLMTCTPYGINTHRLIVQARRVAYNGEDDAPAKTVQAIIHYTVRSFKRTYTLYIIGAAVILFLMVVLFRRGRENARSIRSKTERNGQLPHLAPPYRHLALCGIAPK